MNIAQYCMQLIPDVYESLEQLLNQIQKNNDILAFEKWKKLLETLQNPFISIIVAFENFTKSVYMMPSYDDYLISIMNMFIKYEQKQMNRNGYDYFEFVLLRGLFATSAATFAATSAATSAATFAATCFICIFAAMSMFYLHTLF